MVMEGELLWTPSPARTAASNLTKFSQWLKEHRGLDFADYQAMYEWSVADVDALWGVLWEYFNPKVSAQPTAVLGKRTMPGAEWFPGCGAQLRRKPHGEGRARPDSAHPLQRA